MTNKEYRFIAAMRPMMALIATRCRANKSATTIQNLSSRHLDVNNVVSAQNRHAVNNPAFSTASENQMLPTNIAMPRNTPNSAEAPTPGSFIF